MSLGQRPGVCWALCTIVWHSFHAPHVALCSRVVGRMLNCRACWPALGSSEAAYCLASGHSNTVVEFRAVHSGGCPQPARKLIFIPHDLLPLSTPSPQRLESVTSAAPSCLESNTSFSSIVPPASTAAVFGISACTPMGTLAVDLRAGGLAPIAPS
jgi:hypothetical protein